jgi:Serine-threonine protein kinase 19
MLSQLHSVFTTHTLIEREVSTLIASGVIRKFLLRGASVEGRGGEVNGAGGDYGLLLSSVYTSLLAPHTAELKEFSKWITGPGRTVLSISRSALVAQGVPKEETKRAVELGFITIEYSISEGGYTISAPGSGSFIRNLKRQKYKEMLEKVFLT